MAGRFHVRDHTQEILYEDLCILSVLALDSYRALRDGATTHCATPILGSPAPVAGGRETRSGEKDRQKEGLREAGQLVRHGIGDRTEEKERELHARRSEKHLARGAAEPQEKSDIRRHRRKCGGFFRSGHRRRTRLQPVQRQLRGRRNGGGRRIDRPSGRRRICRPRPGWERQAYVDLFRAVTAAAIAAGALTSLFEAQRWKE